MERRVNGKDSRDTTPRRFIDEEIDRETEKGREREREIERERTVALERKQRPNEFEANF